MNDTFCSAVSIARAEDIFNNFRKYMIAMLLTMFYGAVYLLLSIVLVGLPCLYLGCNYLLVEFYRGARK